MVLECQIYTRVSYRGYCLRALSDMTRDLDLYPSGIVVFKRMKKNNNNNKTLLIMVGCVWFRFLDYDL